MRFIKHMIFQLAFLLAIGGCNGDISSPVAIDPPIPRDLPKNPPNVDDGPKTGSTSSLLGVNATGSAKDFVNAIPGLSEPPIASLSNKFLMVKRSVGAIALIDALLIPLQASGKPYTDFAAFVAGLNSSNIETESTFRAIAAVIDALGLTKGYRITVEENGLNGVFNFRLLGGEPLGDTVQLAKNPSRAHNGNLSYKTNYAGPASFAQYFAAGGCTLASPASCSKKTLNAESALTFNDSSSLADVHMLAIPGETSLASGYVSSYQFAKTANADEIRVLFQVIKDVIDTKRATNIGANDFRLITNAGEHANQSVAHFHVHIVRGGFAKGALLQEPAITKENHRSTVSYSIKEVLGHVSQNSLVAFDIDETLLFEDGHHGHGKLGTKLAEGNNTTEMWTALTKMVNAGTTKVIALTARCHSQEAQTAMNALGLKLDATWLSGVNLTGFNTGSRRNIGAIFYACHTDKGEALIDIIKAPGMFNVERSLFLDDNLFNVNPVMNALKLKLPAIQSLSFFYKGLLHPTTNAPLNANR